MRNLDQQARSGRVRPRCRWSEEGTVSIEFAIIMTAVIIGFFTLMIGAGRVMKQENDVRSATHAAARAASLLDDHGAASANIGSIVDQNLADSGVTCEAHSSAIISGAGDFVPNGFVTVEVSCTARAVGGYGLPANVYSYQATEVIDNYRSQP